jgi:hypothetical protein
MADSTPTFLDLKNQVASMIGAESLADLPEVDQTRMGIFVNQAYRECYAPSDGARTRWSSRSFNVHVPAAKDVTVQVVKGSNQVEIDSDYSSAHLGSFLSLSKDFSVITKTETKTSVPIVQELTPIDVVIGLEQLDEDIDLSAFLGGFVDGVTYKLTISWSGTATLTNGYLLDIKWEGVPQSPSMYFQAAETTTFEFTHSEGAGDDTKILNLSTTDAAAEGDIILATSMSFEDLVYTQPDTAILTLQSPILLDTGSVAGILYYNSHVLDEELIDVSRNPEVLGRGALSAINSPEVAVAMRSWTGSDFRPMSGNVGNMPIITNNGTHIRTESHPRFYYIDNSALIEDIEPVQCRFCLWPAPKVEHNIEFSGNVLPLALELDTDKPRLPGNTVWDILLPIAQGKLAATDPRYNGSNKEMVIATAQLAHQRLKTLSKSQKQKVLRLRKRRGW